MPFGSLITTDRQSWRNHTEARGQTNTTTPAEQGFPNISVHSVYLLVSEPTTLWSAVTWRTYKGPKKTWGTIPTRRSCHTFFNQMRWALRQCHVQYIMASIQMIHSDQTQLEFCQESLTSTVIMIFILIIIIIVFITITDWLIAVYKQAVCFLIVSLHVSQHIDISGYMQLQH